MADPPIIPLSPNDFTVGPREDPEAEKRRKALEAARTNALARIPDSSTTTVAIRPPEGPASPPLPSVNGAPDKRSAVQAALRGALAGATGVGRGARLAGRGALGATRLAGRGASAASRLTGKVVKGKGLVPGPAIKGRSRTLGALERGVSSLTTSKQKPTIELEGEHRDLLDEDIKFIVEAHTIDVDRDVLGTDVVNPIEDDIAGGDPAADFIAGMIGPLQPGGGAADPFGLDYDPFGGRSQVQGRLIQEFPSPVSIPGGLLILGVVEREGEIGYRVSWQNEIMDWFPKD